MPICIDENLKLIKFLHENDKKCYTDFMGIYNALEAEIGKGPLISKDGYTDHGIYHINNMIGLLGNCIIPESFYSDENIEEIFVLLIGVIIHDIDMVNNSTLRPVHSDGATSIMEIEFYEDKYHTIFNSFLTLEQKQVISDITKSHTEWKGNGEEYSHLLHIVEWYRNNDIAKKHGSYKVPLLAAFLRLADELDIDGSRNNAFNYALKANVPESIPYYKVAEMFFKPVLSKNKREIKLSIDGSRYNKCENKSECAVAIVKAFDKLKHEFEDLNRLIFLDKDYGFPGFIINNIVLVEEEKYRQLASEVVSETLKKKRIVIRSVSDNLTKLVDSESLITQTDPKKKERCHYLQEGLSIRNLINFEVVFKSSRIQMICNANTSVYFHNVDCYLMGIGFFGGVAASLLGYTNGRPFGYYYNKNSLYEYGEIENSVQKIENKIVYLVSDAIVTEKTTLQAREELKSLGIVRQDAEFRIFTIFDRKMTNGEYEFLGLKDISMFIALNDSFPAIVCDQKHCATGSSCTNKFINIPKRSGLK